MKFSSIQCRLFSFAVVALFSTLAASANPFKFLYFAPGQNTSPDGRFSLAAFKSSDESTNYYYAKVHSETGTLEVASDAVFEAWGDAPDIRGYGPRVSAWSSRYVEDSDDTYTSNGRIYGEIAASIMYSRKYAYINFQAMQNGMLKNTNFNQEYYETLGRNFLVQKLAESNRGSDLKLSSQMGWVEFILDVGGKYQVDEYPTFDLEDGRLISLTHSYWVSEGENSDDGFVTGFQMILKAKLDSARQFKIELVELIESLE